MKRTAGALDMVIQYDVATDKVKVEVYPAASGGQQKLSSSKSMKWALKIYKYKCA